MILVPKIELLILYDGSHDLWVALKRVLCQVTFVASINCAVILRIFDSKVDRGHLVAIVMKRVCCTNLRIFGLSECF